MPMRFYPSRPSLQEGRVEVQLDWALDTWPPKPVEIPADEQAVVEHDDDPEV